MIYKWMLEIFEKHENTRSCVEDVLNSVIVGVFLFNLSLAIFLAAEIFSRLLDSPSDLWLPLDVYIIFLGSIISIALMDGIIYLITYYVTENENPQRWYISKHVAPKSWTQSKIPWKAGDALFVANVLLGTCVTVIWTLLWLFPVLWTVGGILAGIYAILWLARFIRRLNKKINNHVHNTEKQS